MFKILQGSRYYFDIVDAEPNLIIPKYIKFGLFKLSSDEDENYDNLMHEIACKIIIKNKIKFFVPRFHSRKPFVVVFYLKDNVEKRFFIKDVRPEKTNNINTDISILKTNCISEASLKEIVYILKTNA